MKAEQKEFLRWRQATDAHLTQAKSTMLCIRDIRDDETVRKLLETLEELRTAVNDLTLNTQPGVEQTTPPLRQRLLEWTRLWGDGLTSRLWLRSTGRCVRETRRTP